MTSPRSRLQPLDISLKRHLGYQRARRAVLGTSLCIAFGLPLWHLKALEAQGAGLSSAGGFLRLLSWLPLRPAPAILGPPGAVSLFGLELVDPLALLSVAVSTRPSWFLAGLALPGLLLALVFGRFFCGWACPYLPLLAASNALRGWLGRLGVPLLDVRLPRWLALGVLLGSLWATAVVGAQLFAWCYPPSLLGREVFGALFFGGLGAGALVLLGAFLFDAFVSRAGFCRSLCPGGALYAALALLSPFRIRRDPGRCTDCTVCDVVCNLGQRPMTDRLDEGCERCGKCVSACPTDALQLTVGMPALLSRREERP